jgi:hypothetical protein
LCITGTVITALLDNTLDWIPSGTKEDVSRKGTRTAITFNFAIDFSVVEFKNSINRHNKPSSATMSQRALLTRISHYMFRLIPTPSSGVSYTEHYDTPDDGLGISRNM